MRGAISPCNYCTECDGNFYALDCHNLTQNMVREGGGRQRDGGVETVGWLVWSGCQLTPHNANVRGALSPATTALTVMAISMRLTLNNFTQEMVTVEGWRQRDGGRRTRTERWWWCAALRAGGVLSPL